MASVTGRRDWRSGDHGKRTGFWEGNGQYLLCARYHNPHAPKFKAISPMAPPVRPAGERAGSRVRVDGVGLTIVREVATALDLAVSVTRAPGLGSIFSVNLPAAGTP